MTSLHPSLFLSRLSVWNRGKAVYDETFHLGVNIIRGNNSTGKSTIVDFIFYVLGGDFQKWKPEALRCDTVIAEVIINGVKVTIRREVSAARSQKMAIYWGPYEQARQNITIGWNIYPFGRTSETESFSQLLFRTLGMPEVRAEEGRSLTMHQILRLIVIDQISSIDSLLREEEFDSGLVRRAVGDLLFGIYDNQLYANEVELRAKRSMLDDLTKQIDNLVEVLGSVGQTRSSKEYDKEIKETNERLTRTLVAIDQATSSAQPETASQSIKELDHFRQVAQKSKAALSEAQRQIEVLDFDITDSAQFINSLEARLRSLDESITTRTVLGNLTLSYCPQCLSPLTKTNQEHVCSLCNAEVAPESHNARALRMKQEMALQIKESQILLTAKESRLKEVREGLPILINKARQDIREFELKSRTVQSVRDETLNDLYSQKGSLESQISYLEQQARAAQVLERLKREKNQLQGIVGTLEIEIRQARTRQAEKLGLAMEKIQDHTFYFLRNDLKDEGKPLEEFFSLANTLTIDFSKNTFAIDGRNQFSASSVTYLRNSIHFGILLASLELDFFRYPRLIVCDNIEDKGMKEARSHQFQKLVVEASKRFDVEHQIIFTTSMIEPELNNPAFCVGPAYTPANKTLHFE